MTYPLPVSSTLWPAAPRRQNIVQCLDDLAVHHPAMRAEPAWSIACALAAQVEDSGAQAAVRQGELPYHNREHLTDVLLALGLLFDHATLQLTAGQKVMLVIAMLAHDLDHPGRSNAYPYELEEHAWRQASGHFSGQTPAWRRRVRHIILSTDPRSYHRLDRAILPRQRVLVHMAVEADLYASLQPARGFYLGHQLSLELLAHNPQLAAHLDTLEGRLRFLQHCKAHSVAAAALQLNEVIAAQISVIRQLPSEARMRPWSTQWGQDYAAMVAARFHG